jgi:hypothetical protein
MDKKQSKPMQEIDLDTLDVVIGGCANGECGCLALNEQLGGKRRKGQRQQQIQMG